MNKKISNIALSLSAIIALSSCGTSSDYKAKNNEGGVNPTTPKTGLTGQVLADKTLSDVTVCFDTNKDGLCGTNEDKTKTDSKGKYTFLKNISDKNPDSLLVANVKESDSIKYVLTAKQTQGITASEVSNKTQNITPYTTLVVNEDKYNLQVKKGTITSYKYLNDKLGLKEDIFKGKDYLTDTNILNDAKGLVNAYKQAYELESKNPLLSIATVVDELIKTKSYTMNITAIAPQTVDLPEDKFKLTDMSKSVSWDKAYKDETVLGMASSDNKLIVNSRWNNRLTVVDTTDKMLPKIIQNEKYIYVNGGKDARDSVTGATEEILRKVEMSKDGNTIYSLITKYKSDDSDNRGVGIYKANISSAVPSSVIFSRIETGNKYFKNGTISDISLSKDASLLLASSENDKKIYGFNNTLDKEAFEISTEKKPKSVLVSADKKYAYVGLSARKNNSLAIYDIATKKLLSEYKTEYAPQFLAYDNNNLFVANNDENSVLELDISNKSNIKLKNTFKTSYPVKQISISDNKKYLIVSTNNKKAYIFDLSNSKRKDMLSLSENVVGAYSISNDKIAVNYGRNVGYYSITDTKPQITDDIVTQWEQAHRE